MAKTFKRAERLKAMNYQNRAEKCAFEVGYYEGFTYDGTQETCTSYATSADMIAHGHGYRCGRMDSQ